MIAILLITTVVTVVAVKEPPAPVSRPEPLALSRLGVVALAAGTLAALAWLGYLLLPLGSWAPAVVAGGVAGQLKTLGGNVGSHGDDGTVARVRSGGTCEFVERLPGSFEVVDADIKNDVRAHWFTPHEKAARAILLIGLGKNAADAESALGKRSPRRETANIVAGFYESPDDVFRNGVDQRVGLLGGRFFGGSV